MAAVSNTLVSQQNNRSEPTGAMYIVIRDNRTNDYTYPEFHGSHSTKTRKQFVSEFHIQHNSNNTCVSILGSGSHCSIGEAMPFPGGARTRKHKVTRGNEGSLIENDSLRSPVMTRPSLRVKEEESALRGTSSISLIGNCCTPAKYPPFHYPYPYVM
eukprot:752855-Hanusia_phi.AAC.3